MIHLFRAALAAGAVLLGVGAPSVLAQTPPDPLIGLWCYQTISTPALKGPLTVWRQGSVWRASIAGKQANAHVLGGSLRFVFPDGLGQFRGRPTDHNHRLDGYWLRPAEPAIARGAPIGAAQAFATPVVLRPTSTGRWLGEVAPLANSFTLYLKVFRDTDGALTAAFRNPELNSIGGRTQFLVNRDGGAVRFASRPAADQQPIALTADLSGDRLHILWPDLGRGIDLTRRTPQQAAAFFPRPPGEPRYAYRVPPAGHDGWATARAADVGLDPTALERVVQAQIDSDPTARRPSLMHSILVARRGKLVLEEYFFGFDRTTPHDIRSAGKTYGSVMLGAAMRRDPALGPQSRIYDLMAGLGPFANPDPRKARITLAELMTQTSGLACDDNDDTSPGREELMQAQPGQPNWWKYALDLPMAHDPGSRYAYCSANSNLVGGALTARTGVWLPEYFDREIARPLQFGSYSWNLAADDEGYLGGGAFMTSRDFLKIGQAYLDGGVWHGRRIVSAAWVKVSTSPHIDVSPATTGLSPEEFGNFYGLAKDGYAWHLNDLKVGDKIYRDYEATGNGGQLLIVVPDADLVVVITAGNYGQGGIWTRWRDSIVAQQIIPAIR